MEEKPDFTANDFSPEEEERRKLFDDMQNVIRFHLGKRIYEKQFVVIMDVLSLLLAEYIGQLEPAGQEEQAGYMAQMVATRLAEINEIREAQEQAMVADRMKQPPAGNA